MNRKNTKVHKNVKNMYINLKNENLNVFNKIRKQKQERVTVRSRTRNYLRKEFRYMVNGKYANDLTSEDWKERMEIAGDEKAGFKERRVRQDVDEMRAHCS